MGYDSIHSELKRKGEPPMSEASHFQNRYHIQFKGRRTTITLDKILSELIATKLGFSPEQEGVHSIVQQWLQTTLTENLGENVPGGNRISQYARKYAIEAIADPDLMEKILDWRLSQF